MRHNPLLYEIREYGKPVSEMTMDELQQALCSFFNIIAEAPIFSTAVTYEIIAKKGDSHDD